MIFAIKLRSGFFKTRPYYLNIDPGRLVLTPQEGREFGRLVLEADDLISISVIQRSARVRELEIISREGTFLGSFINQADLEEAARLLAREFGAKFSLQYNPV
ncbi:MAG: hypothetical protein PHG75_02510 [Syntrophomonas sp.]|nr:hypothetical protein [Syntrophomonas sp.]